MAQSPPTKIKTRTKTNPPAKDPTRLANGKPKPEGYKGTGRPSDYLPEYCQAILDYFCVDAQTTSKRTIITAKGTVIEEETERARSLPTIEGFAESLHTTVQTVITWTEEHAEFLEAYTCAKAAQKRILIDNGTKGLYNSQFTIFVAKNCTDMKDKVEISADDGLLDAVLAVLKGGKR